MARLSNANTPDTSRDPTAINLNRMLARLQQILITPDSDTESRLRTAGLEREKVNTNLEYARTLLLRLEQDAQNIKVQTRKQETQTELLKKRETIQRMSERLQELNDLGAHEDDDEDSSEGEDLLGEDTPSEDTTSYTSQVDTQSATPSPTEFIPPPLPAEPETISPSISSAYSQDPPPEEPQSVLRSRKDPHAELLSEATSQTTGASLPNATTDALLTHNRTEQETLTNSLLSMASALKESSHAFSSSLEEEKSILDNATQGLDKSELGLDVAGKRMGALRRMTEGRGWWGRMLMYAWIAGLMVIAILIVFVLPKLRF